MYCKNYILSFTQEGEGHDILGQAQGELANFTPIAGMGHRISEPKLKLKSPKVALSRLKSP